MSVGAPISLPELEPDQIPEFVGAADLRRWKLCVGWTRRIAGHDDFLFATALFFSELATDETELPVGDTRTEVVEAFDQRELRDRSGRWTKDWARGLKPEAMKSPGVVTPEQMRQAGFDEWPQKGEVARRILGDRYDTTELYEDPAKVGEPEEWRYTSDRLAEHDRIVHKLTDNHEHQDEPHVLVVAGGPASGKSTFLRMFPSLPIVPSDAVHLNADDIKKELPEYQEMSEVHDPYAAVGTHRESGDVLAKALDRAFDRRQNVILDGTGDERAGRFKHTLERFRDQGYKVDVLYVTVPTEEAVARNLVRAQTERRYVPTSVVREKHREVSIRFRDEISKMPWLASLNVFDEKGLVATKSGRKIEVMDPVRYAGFVDKAEEPEQHTPERPREMAEAKDVDVPESVIVDPEPFDLVPRSEAHRRVRERKRSIE